MSAWGAAPQSSEGRPELQRRDAAGCTPEPRDAPELQRRDAAGCAPKPRRLTLTSSRR